MSPISVLSFRYDPADPRTERALKLCEGHNPNDLRQPGVNFAEGLEGEQKRWTPLGGAVSQAQLDFLERELADSDGKGERVLVLSHVALHPCANSPICVVWNFAEVLAALHRHPSASAVFCGHDHSGGYHLDEAGVHHVTFKSPLNCGLNEHSFAIAELYRDRILLQGHGNEHTRELVLARGCEWQARIMLWRSPSAVSAALQGVADTDDSVGLKCHPTLELVGTEVLVDMSPAATAAVNMATARHESSATYSARDGTACRVAIHPGGCTAVQLAYDPAGEMRLVRRAWAGRPAAEAGRAPGRTDWGFIVPMLAALEAMRRALVDGQEDVAAVLAALATLAKLEPTRELLTANVSMIAEIRQLRRHPHDNVRREASFVHKRWQALVQ